MINDFNQIPNSARTYSEQEKLRNKIKKQEKFEKQKIDLYNQNSIKIAEETKSIGKEALIVSKRTLYIAIIAFIISIISLIVTFFK